MEWWNIGLKKDSIPLSPLFQHSIFPSFQYSMKFSSRYSLLKAVPIPGREAPEIAGSLAYPSEERQGGLNVVRK
jgi:hypothetical protein